MNGPPSASPVESSTTGLDPNVASALTYVAGPLSGVLVLMAERSNTAVRFHAWQSIVGIGGLWVAGLLLYVLAFAAIFVSASALLILLYIAAGLFVGSVVLMAICGVKAYGGQRWKLPLAGEFAERKAVATPR